MLLKNTSQTNARGITDAKGRIVTIAPGETREINLSEKDETRYRAKIAGGDTLEIVGDDTTKPAKAPAAKETKAPKPPKAKEPKPETKKPETGDGSTKLPPELAPAEGSKEALQLEAKNLGVEGWQNFGPARLRREIAAKKAEKKG